MKKFVFALLLVIMMAGMVAGLAFAQERGGGSETRCTTNCGGGSSTVC